MVRREGCTQKREGGRGRALCSGENWGSCARGGGGCIEGGGLHKKKRGGGGGDGPRGGRPEGVECKKKGGGRERWWGERERAKPQRTRVGVNDLAGECFQIIGLFKK
jgi:hypothetical protein